MQTLLAYFLLGLVFIFLTLICKQPVTRKAIAVSSSFVVRGTVDKSSDWIKRDFAIAPIEVKEK